MRLYMSLLAGTAAILVPLSAASGQGAGVQAEAAASEVKSYDSIIFVHSREGERRMQSARIDYQQLDRAIEACDKVAADLWLSRLRSVVETLRREAGAAQAAGEFSTIDPADAQQVLGFARDALKASEERVKRRLPCQKADDQPSQANSTAREQSAPAAAQQGVSPGDRRRIATQQRLIDGIEADFAAMEAARLRGDCKSFRLTAAAAAERLGELLSSGVVAPRVVGELRQRLTNLEARPCPPSGTEPTSAFRPQSVLRPKRLAAIGIGMGQSDTPPTGIGFRREGAPGEAPEEFAVTTPAHVDSTGVHVSATFVEAMIEAHYTEGNGSSTFDIPGDAGIDSGVVYGGLSPSGSSGIATPFGLSGEVSTHFSEWHFGGGYRLLGGGDAGGSRSTDVERAAFELNAIFGYWLREGQYRGSASYSGAIDDDPYTVDYSFSQMREQSLDEDIYEVGLSGTAWFVPTGPLRPYLSLDASIYRRSTELHSIEINTSNFGPADDREFTLMFEDSDKSIGFHGAATAGVEVEVSRYFAINLGMEADYWSEVGSVWNPNSGDQVYYDGLTTRLEKEDAWDWRGVLGARLRF